MNNPVLSEEEESSQIIEIRETESIPVFYELGLIDLVCLVHPADQTGSA